MKPVPPRTTCGPDDPHWCGCPCWEAGYKAEIRALRARIAELDAALALIVRPEEVRE